MAAVALTGAPTVITEPSPPASDAADAFSQALSRLPATALDADGAVLQYADLDLAWERAGVGEEVDERLEHQLVLSEMDTFTQPAQLFGQMAAMTEEARAEVGFTYFDIRREIAVLAPPRNVIFAETTVSAEQVVAAVRSDPVWAEELVDVDTPAGGYFVWDRDPLEMVLERRSPLRPLGQGGALAVIGDTDPTVVRAIFPADVEQVLTTSAGRSASLLEEGPINDAITAIPAGGDVVQVIALGAPIIFDPSGVLLDPALPVDSIEDALAAITVLAPYRSLVIVERWDGERSIADVLLVHDDEQSAADNADVVEEWLRSGVDLRTGRPVAELLPNAEVTVDGVVLRVETPAPRAYAVAQRMVFDRSLLPVG